MAWPAGPIDTTDLDAGTDSPATARTDLLATTQAVNDIVASRAAASGIPSLDANTRVPQTQLPKMARVVDATAGSGKTWTVPTGVTRVRVRVAGAGGGGGYTTPGTGGDHGGGGGAGAYAEKDFDTVPGDDFTYTVGAKGTGKDISSDGDGADGGFSSVTSASTFTPASYTVTADGGHGGQGPPNRFGGGGGQATNGDLNLPGGAGQSGGTRGGVGGGNTLTGGSAGSTTYGGGGGFGSGDSTPGFDGLAGVVIFEYWKQA